MSTPMHARVPAIAIVGAGPAGCYTAQALRKRMPEAHLVVFDQLPVPYGLLRYGVAADHQGTKAVCAQFERLFRRDAVEFRGGVRVGVDDGGCDVTVADLREAFDVVVLATGLATDRRLGVAGENVHGVIGSGRLTRALNSHPDETGSPPEVGRRVAVVGAGNIAVDVVRLLLRSPSEWTNSDMDPKILNRIVPEPVESIDVIVRASAYNAKWDAAMIRELGDLGRAQFQSASLPREGPDEPRVSALRDLVDSDRIGDATVTFHFDAVVQSLGSCNGDLERVVIRTASGSLQEIPVDTVITAIGFESDASVVADGVYAAGWLATGPRGTIPQQRALAQDLAALIASHLGPAERSAARAGLLALNLPNAVDYDAWCRIDATEQSQAHPDRVRRKLSSHALLWAASHPANSSPADTAAKERVPA